MKVQSGLYYSEDHEWVRVEGSIAYIGISDYAQHELGDIVYVELPDEDDEFEKGDSLGTIESVKAATDILMPISGRVIEINDELEDSPEKVNAEAYEAWLIKLEFTNEAELKDLMTAEKYEEFLKED